MRDKILFSCEDEDNSLSTGRITQGSARSKPAQFLPGQLAAELVLKCLL